MTEEAILIHITLKDEAAERFELLKKWFGLKHDTEVIRLLTSVTYHSLELEGE